MKSPGQPLTRPVDEPGRCLKSGVGINRDAA